MSHEWFTIIIISIFTIENFVFKLTTKLKIEIQWKNKSQENEVKYLTNSLNQGFSNSLKLQIILNVTIYSKFSEALIYSLIPFH